MKKKKFITPKMRVIKLDAEELMQTPQSGGDTTQSANLQGATYTGGGWYDTASNTSNNGGDNGEE